MTDKQSAPAYTEEQATRWLAWLAYNMRRRDMTIFQIESLQPDWLSNRLETIIHILLTRILWGIWSGVVFWWMLGLIYGIFYDRNLSDRSVGLILGPIVGLFVGLIELVIPIHKLDAFLRERNSSIRNFATVVLIYGLASGLVGGPLLWLFVSRAISVLVVGFTIFLFIGLFIGFIRTLRITFRNANGSIRTTESVSWSWRNIYANIIRGFILGLIVGLVFGLIVGMDSERPFENERGLIGGLFIGQASGLFNGLFLGLANGLLGGLIGGLIGGFQPRAEELKIYPNQGIWLTVSTAFKIGIPVGLMIGFLIWLPYQESEIGLEYALLTSCIISSVYGGIDLIEHGIIRLILAWRGHAPLNYAHFLDYAAQELNFLQKVGGGYIFIHRYLLEHFAEIAVEKGYVSKAAMRQHHPNASPSLSTKQQ